MNQYSAHVFDDDEVYFAEFLRPQIATKMVIPEDRVRNVYVYEGNYISLL